MLNRFMSLLALAAALLTVPLLLACTTEDNFRASLYNVHSQETTVYTTNTGTKYHRSSCRYLKQSKNKTTIKKAIAAGNSACKVCKP